MIVKATPVKDSTSTSVHVAGAPMAPVHHVLVAEGEHLVRAWARDCLRRHHQLTGREASSANVTKSGGRHSVYDNCIEGAEAGAYYVRTWVVGALTSRGQRGCPVHNR